MERGRGERTSKQASKQAIANGKQFCQSMHNLFIIYILHTSSSSEELFLLSTVFLLGRSSGFLQNGWARVEVLRWEEDGGKEEDEGRVVLFNFISM